MLAEAVVLSLLRVVACVQIHCEKCEGLLGHVIVERNGTRVVQQMHEGGLKIRLCKDKDGTDRPESCLFNNRFKIV